MDFRFPQHSSLSEACLRLLKADCPDSLNADAGLNVGYIGVADLYLPRHAASSIGAWREHATAIKTVARMGTAKIRGWRIGYWVVMAISSAWFLLALVASGYLLFSRTDGAWRMHQRSFTELIVGTMVVVQPLLIIWLILRAYKLRHQGAKFFVIGRAALPLSTGLLIVATVAANIYNDNRLAKIAMGQLFNGSVIFDCSKSSEVVDFNREKIGPIELRLTSTRRDRGPRRWIVQWPGKAPIVATNFDAATGSYGGSQGLSWTGTDGKPMSALLSFSDILGPYGPQTIWVTVVSAKQAQIQQKLDAGEITNFTCGLDLKSYHE
ncbi:MAG: hypothetical protein V4579_13180 [Pseudomonadota bacterium]